jgi:hypothetical protein
MSLYLIYREAEDFTLMREGQKVLDDVINGIVSIWSIPGYGVKIDKDKMTIIEENR